jgi:TonB family protein
MMLAIDKQKIYPWEASESHIGGKVIVSFNYMSDGIAKNIHVDASSGNRYLDEAALEAVANAKLPPKPPELSAATHFIVEILFAVHH